MTLGLVLFFSSVTWLITMMFYTEKYKVLLHEEGLVKVKCSHCSKPIITHYKNLRQPMYCNWCK
jgi:hypothetical protein